MREAEAFSIGIRAVMDKIEPTASLLECRAACVGKQGRLTHGLSLVCNGIDTTAVLVNAALVVDLPLVLLLAALSFLGLYYTDRLFSDVITRTRSTRHLPFMGNGLVNTDSISVELDHGRFSGRNGYQEDDSPVDRKQETIETSLPCMGAPPSETAGSSENHRKKRIADMNTPAQSSADARSVHAVAGSSSDVRGLAGREKLQQKMKSQVARQSRNQPTKGVTEGSEMMFNGYQELSIRLTGHIVICTIGLERGFSKGKSALVAICSRLSEEEEVELELYAPNSGIL
ncbi:hypothetical protein FGB62_28g01 [Gracilaria domingensis]|nr:hypothetical protein FGB62_28g01 [Gracilaria domingensis]